MGCIFDFTFRLSLFSECGVERAGVQRQNGGFGMIEIETIADLELLRESVDLECKLAAGRDG